MCNIIFYKSKLITSYIEYVVIRIMAGRFRCKILSAYFSLLLYTKNMCVSVPCNDNRYFVFVIMCSVYLLYLRLRPGNLRAIKTSGIAC